MKNLQKTKDLWFASFLSIKGVEPIDYKLLPNNRGEYYYDVDIDEWKSYKLEFRDSTVSKVKYIQETLKDLVH